MESLQENQSLSFEEKNFEDCNFSRITNSYGFLKLLKMFEITIIVSAYHVYEDIWKVKISSELPFT